MVDDDARDRKDLRHVGEVANRLEIGEQREPSAAEEVAALAADRQYGHPLDLWLPLQGQRGAGAVHVGVQSTGQTTIRRDMQKGEVDDLALLQQRRQLVRSGTASGPGEV